MTTTYDPAEPITLDPAEFPVLTGPEADFFDYWWRNIMLPEDPHNMRWIEYEEGAVERARERLEVLNEMEDVKGKRILEIGCQGGAGLIALAQMGAHAVGIDVDAPNLEAAKIRAKGYGVEVHPTEASASELPYPSGEFDIVVSYDVLEHVPDKEAMLHEAVRVLRPGGLLMLSAPNRWGVKLLLADPHYKRKGITPLPAPLARGWVMHRHHEIEYDVETLPTCSWTERRLRRHGLELIPGPGKTFGDGVGRLVDRLKDNLRQGFTIYGRKKPGIGAAAN